MIRNSLRAAAASLLFLAPALPAQISWGPAVGLVLSTFGGADASDASTEQANKMGFAGAVVIDKATEGKPLFWRTGLGFNQAGSVGKDKATGDKFTLKLNYITIPVMAGWKLGTAGQKTAPYVAGGVQAGLKAGCDTEFESAGSTQSFPCDDPIFSGSIDIKGLDLALIVGGGVSMAAGSGTIDISAMFSKGLSTIDNSAAEDDIKNQAFSFVVVYKIPMKKK